MDRNKQISAWRDAIELMISFVGKVDDYNQGFVMFILAVRQGLKVENWSDFERLLKAILFGFSPRSTGRIFGSPQRSLREELKRALEYFEPQILKNFNVKIEDSGLIMMPTFGVTLRITKEPRNTIVFRFKFGSPKTGTEFKKMMDERLGSNHSVRWGEVIYEDAINLRSEFSSDHWIFSNGSLDRLRDRSVLTSGTFDRYKAFVVRPRPGEKLIVYSGQGAMDIGLHVPHSRTAPRHPDTKVFASIGPFSLALERGEAQRGRIARDRVVVFVDTCLPIAPAPPKYDEDEPYDYHDDDYDPADYDPPEY